MLPSLYSGISGLKVNQQKLNIVANNIANSSTTGFKSQAMDFEDMMSQNLSDPSAPVNNGVGGINGRQSGLGVKIAGISTDFTAGSSQSTGRSLDFMINEGGSYFVVSPDGDSVDDTGAVTTNTTRNYYYTRDRAFVLDEQGNLLTQDGNHVMGYNVDPTTGAVTDAATGTDANNITPPKCLQIAQYYNTDGTVDTGKTAENKVTSWSIGSTGIISVKTSASATASTTGAIDVGQVALASFQNESGLVKDGGNIYESSSNSGTATYGTPGASGYGSITQGTLEMSNVDLAQQFTDMIIASRAFSANGKIISTDDEILQELVNLKRS